MTSDITWGPEIRVDGKRPEWLGEGQEFQAGGGTFEWFGIVCNGAPHIWNRNPNREPSWNGVDRIRLPSDHPHYAQEVPRNSEAPQFASKLPTAPSGGEVGPEVVERMIALVRRMVSDPGRQLTAASDNDYAEARAIVALLPSPTDPNLIEARKIVFQANQHAGGIMCGEWDDRECVRMALAGVRRGRGLERGERV